MEERPELEQFRQQWRAEVTAKAQSDGKRSKTSKATRKPPPISRLASSSKATQPPHDDEASQTRYVEPEDREDTAEGSKSGGKNPESALEHYEKAVEMETQGSLGDSLGLYRKAFRMDHKVDQTYKNKHFPPSYFASKATNPNPSNTAVTVPNPAHHSLDGPPQSLKDLLASFSALKIEPAPASIEGTPPPPCPLAELPEEILTHILTDLAVMDVESLARTAQVCKRLAYIVTTEDRIWKRVCLGSEVGFGAMHYTFQCEIFGEPLEDNTYSDLDDLEDDNKTLPHPSPEAITTTLLTTTFASSWRTMLRQRPRIRFNGCYISTVNYMRPGQASVTQVTTWSAPVHIVTYYRYLRFFRDGSVLSLLSTTEPVDVVPYLTKALQVAHRRGAQAYLPSIVMQNALRGRWRLSSEGDAEGEGEGEGDVFVETEGASAKYIYRMKLSLRSSAGAKKCNNKLVWRGFWNYNMLTDDSGEFTLKNDKAFWWSRVRSYGDGA